ncbi:MAG TPA: prolyl oligopeptidase family serine peptidase [Pirellulales bacterium]|jgi:dienelactone hydrolase|nr:prolyl oligopeptidase family serine peptidase [Pirellulales bacterium]
MLVRCRLPLLPAILVIGSHVCVAPAHAQALGQPERGEPGDEMMQAYLAREAAKISARFAADVSSKSEWEAKRPAYIEQYFYMLGLSPRSEKTPPAATVTSSLTGDGYIVDKLHYQSLPGLYVTGNLYRPAAVKQGEKLPAVFYVCGHSGRGRNGNKVAFQSHGIWFARHGYICLIVDTLQLGEIAAFHHGTYNLGRWWWHSRGYTPAGVEAWNGVRGIDYLVGRPDVDADRIAVTGISGGGAATFWIAAADERVKVAVPVSGMADLESYVPNRVINGHCDCMFLYNTFQWPWTRIASLVAPRPLLFVNSDQDAIFPMDANERIINRLERVYSLYGRGDRVDAVVSIGGHAYRQDIRQAAFGFINAHLKGAASPVLDSEIDVVSEGGNPEKYPIPPESLRVFPTDDLLPADQINQTVDQMFVPLADAPLPETGHFDEWKRKLLAELRRVSFGYFPEQIPAAKKRGDAEGDTQRLESEEGIEFRLRGKKGALDGSDDILLAVLNEDEAGTAPEWLKDQTTSHVRVVYCEPRGVGATRWTRRNPPNYVERSHALLGRTVDAGRVWDVIAAAKYLSTSGTADGTKRSVTVAGRGAAGIIAAYAAALSDDIAAAIAVSPAKTHMEAAAPQLLNVLRVCDVPDALGLIAPRPLKIVGGDRSAFAKTLAIYAAAGAPERLTSEE